MEDKKIIDFTLKRTELQVKKDKALLEQLLNEGLNLKELVYNPDKYTKKRD